MTGLQLARLYYEQVGRSRLMEQFPQLNGQLAVGRVGEGSECFGLDDALSRDHDYGPGFCLWMDEAIFLRWGAQLQRAYRALPDTYAGYRRPTEGPFLRREGPMSTSAFYRQFLGPGGLPQSEEDWMALPQETLAACTNGEVFADPPGTFSAIRRHLLAGYPEQVRRKKMAAHCALAGQAGQYNHLRCIVREDPCAILWARQQFIYHFQAAVFLLNRRFMPYGKWARQALVRLDKLGDVCAPLLDRVACGQAAQEAIEDACSLLASHLRVCGLSTAPGSSLLAHGQAIQDTLTSPALARLPLLSWRSGWQI